MQASPVARINLEKLSAVIVERNQQALDLMTQILASFGLTNIDRFGAGADAQAYLACNATDLLITEAEVGEPNGFGLIQWLRREAHVDSRFIPVILVTGHVRRAQVLQARDCGASFTVVKPISPKVLMDRLFWAASDARMFVETDAFVGPDRRFRNDGPPVGCEGRRATDLKGEIGHADSPNLSQDDIDFLVKPQKVKP